LKFKRTDKNTLFFIITLILITVTMFVAVSQKEGFHEDEIYSFGSSNNKYGDIFYASGDRDATNRTVDKLIIGDDFKSTFENYIYYKKNPELFKEVENKEIESETPVWKTPSDAKDYLTVTEDEIFNYISPYYNQTRDVHPPLFYFLVHLVSSFALGSFSKYIIFSINLVFMLLTCLVLRKILKLYNRDYLIVPVTILYGLSMGAISMVIFFRMYAMLTFFCMAYFYLTLKIEKSNFKADKGTAFLLCVTTVLGFLTQYYFCLFAVPVFLAMMIRMISLKKYKEIFHYAKYHVISAIIGILLFPSSINHIFFSSRGLNSLTNISYFSQLNDFMERILYAFSFPRALGIIVFFVALSYIFIKFVKRTDNPEERTTQLFNIMLIVVPIVVFILLVVKLSPSFNEKKYMVRYITPVLPLIAISFTVMIDNIIRDLIGATPKNKSIIIYGVVLLLTVTGFFTSSPSYLYKGYNKYLDIANEYKDLNYVYVYDNYYTHLNSLPEMTIYNKTLIINMNDEKQMETLKNDEELKNCDKFVLSLKDWLDEDSLEKVLKTTGFNNATVLLDEEDDTASKLYLISK